MEMVKVRREESMESNDKNVILKSNGQDRSPKGQDRN